MQPSKEVEVTFTRHYTLIEHQCPHCQTVFMGAKTKVYCSTTCAQRAAWQRNGEKYLAKKRSDKE